MTLWMTKGLPASGKSTWAKEWVRNSKNPALRVNKDDLRAMLHDGKHSKANEELVLLIRDYIVDEALGSGVHVIVDDTNFHPKHEARLREIAAEHDTEFRIKDFSDVPLETCIERNQDRPNSVPERVIRRMYDDFLKPPPDLSWVDESLPPCIMVDLDGTLAHMGKNRGPYDWDKVGGDEIDPNVLRFINQMNPEGLGSGIVLLSGRDSVCRGETEEWLARHSVNYEELWMRPNNDNRSDAIVKRELFDKHIRGRWNPYLVLDDRDRVVKMWREELGFTVWQVAPGSF